MKPKSPRATSALPWFILAAFTVCWFSFFALTSSQPGGPDVFVFRDAGCNWAQGRGLTAASVPHANTVNPMLFASYTPGTPLLFGVAASLFGCSASVDTFYNLALAAAAVFLLYGCFSLAVTSGWQRVWAALLLGTLLPPEWSHSTPIAQRCRRSAYWSPFSSCGAGRRLSPPGQCCSLARVSSF